MQRTWYTLGLYRSPNTSSSDGGGGFDLMDNEEDVNNDGQEEEENEEEEEADGGGTESSPRPGPPLGDKLNELIDNESKTEDGEPAAAGTGEGLSALDAAASQLFGVKDGLIQFDGEDEPVAFSSLSADEQADVMGQHARNQQAQQPTAAERTLLTEIARSGGVENWARQQASALSAQPAGALTDDQINLRDIQTRYPKFTKDEQDAELESRKNNTLYSKKTDSMRESQQGQEQVAAQQAAVQENQLVADNLIEAARGLSEIDGFVMSPDVLNNVLEDLLEADEGQADSRFLMSLDDPREMIRTRFWSKYGPALVAAAENAAKSGGKKASPAASTQGVKQGRYVAPTATAGKNKAGGGTDLMN